MNKGNFTIMHVEDDPALAELVKIALMSFGFTGVIIPAERVNKALEILDERDRSGEPLNLILVDMQLPDGTGLDVIREVRANPSWRLTPIVVLSSEVAPGMINGAYALGANCYLPKASGEKSLSALKSLYHCWFQRALLPHPSNTNRLQDAMARAIGLRTRTADFYFRIARIFEQNPEEMRFWLDQALNEGNLSNLMAFFQNRVGERDMPVECIDRLADMQGQVRKALASAEVSLNATPSPPTVVIYDWVFTIIDALEEDVINKALGCLFPRGPAATLALKARASAQLQRIACHVLERTDEPSLCQRAEKLLHWSTLMAGASDGTARGGSSKGGDKADEAAGKCCVQERQ